MKPVEFRFGSPHGLDRLLREMLDALRNGEYAPDVDADGAWRLFDDRAILRNATERTPRIRFSSRTGSRPTPDRAVEAALLSLSPHGDLLPLGEAGVENRIDALLRILGTTCSTPWSDEPIRLVHAPTPWAPLRVEARVSMNRRSDIVADGDGCDLIPTCVHAQWASRVEGGSDTPITGYEIEPFNVAIRHDWSPDPMDAMRTLQTAAEQRS